MASCSKALLSSTLEHCSPFFSSSLRPHLSFFRNSSSLGVGGIKLIDSSVYPSISSEEQAKPLSFSVSFRKHICKAAEYKFPDPIPEFADAETEKFRAHLLNKLAKRDIFGNSLEEVVGICTELVDIGLQANHLLINARSAHVYDDWKTKVTRYSAPSYIANMVVLEHSWSFHSLTWLIL
ncbi:Protein PLASTID REDOX INSENSITIVE 2 like [Melia azedarach]|uniref:Protein PLASTID REDOX INSENSITIVE 2 like n=1 Tax=Melia azedarach TaxID=155640 RepID=A0ACC1XIB1_MELAZ|nr:Protein PLASTID REDOX INSENSITIVE 2 like [Melia azedarach]